MSPDPSKYDDWEDITDQNIDPYADWEDITEPSGEEYGLAETVVRGAGLMPRQFASRLMQAYEGAGAEEVYDDDFTGRFIEKSRKQSEEYLSHVPEGGDTVLGFSKRDVGETMANLPYSGAIWAGMGAGGIAGTASPVPGGGTVGALGAGTAMGKRMASNEFSRSYKDLLDNELMAERGSPLTLDEWNSVYEDFEAKADAYGWWEAIPETVGSLVGAKLLFGGLKSIVGKKVAGKVAEKLGSVVGKGAVGKTAGLAGRFGVTAAEELAQETITQKGQGGIEADVGMRGEAPTWGESFEEIKNPTLLTTGLLGAGGGVGVKSYRALRKSAFEEKDLMGSGLISREDNQRSQYLDKLFQGLDDGSVTIDKIQVLREKETDEVLAKMLDDIFLKPSPGIEDETAEIKGKLREQAHGNKAAQDAEAAAMAEQEAQAQAEQEAAATLQAEQQKEAALDMIADKIASGETEFSPEELQIQANFPDEIEQRLAEMQPEVAEPEILEEPLAPEPEEVAPIEPFVEPEPTPLPEPLESEKSPEIAPMEAVEDEKGVAEKPKPKALPETPKAKEPLGSKEYIQAKKLPDGTYQLFYRGTRNEIFPGEKFRSAKEARDYFDVQKAKESTQGLKPKEAESQLSKVTVKIKAQNERGTIFEIEEDAQTALTDTESKSETLYSFLECLK